MEYNTQLPRLVLPEYGRNVQRMVAHCCTIQDREERNRCAKAIIQVMGQLNPQLRDIEDYNHKLWDHLFIISDFKLDVDSPYPIPNPEILDTKPNSVEYPSGKIRYRHYGRIIEDIIQKAKTIEEGSEKEEIKVLIANQLKRLYINWNKDSVADDVIAKNLNELSGGSLILSEELKLSDRSELVSKKQNFQHKGKHHHKHNKKHNFKRKY
jgi:hypothetical protein